MVIDNKNLEIVLFNAFLPRHKLKRLCCWANEVDKPDWVLGPRWVTVLPRLWMHSDKMWAYSTVQNNPFSNIFLVNSCLVSHQNSS